MATQFDPIAKDESLNTTEATPRNIADVIAEGLKGIEDALPTYTEGDGIDLSNNEISVDTTFTEASTRANIASGDSFSTILGKIKKFFTDLKAVAFSGAAADVAYGSGSVADALAGLNDDIHGIKASVSVAAENLYTYTTPGTYCVFISSSASPLTAGDLCVLEVFAVKYNNTTSGYVQRLNRVYPTTGVKIFQRAYYPASGGWSAWKDISDDVEYYDYAVAMSVSSSVSPFTYYANVDISAFASGKKILSAQPIVTGSAQRAIATINNTQTTAYVYGTDGSNIVLRVHAKKA